MTTSPQTTIPVKKNVEYDEKLKEDVNQKLYAAFNDSLNKTKAELEQVKSKLREYDEKYQASSKIQDQGQKASDFLHSTLEEIKVSLDGLFQKAHQVFIEAKDVTEEAIKDLWNKLRQQFEKLKQLTIEFDDKYHVSERLTELTAPLVNQLKTFEKSLDQAGSAIKDVTKSGRNYVIGAAASLEHKYSIEDKLNNLDQKYKIVETAKTLQTKGEEFIVQQHILERVKQLDEKFTGSKVGEFVEQGVKRVQEELEKVEQEYSSAKKKDE